MEWWRQSMKDRAERVAWFRQARFGMFVHWGAYSHLGGVWQGKPVEGYAEHIMRKEKIPSAVYQKELAAPFNPTEFDADEWMANAKQAGMAYFIITSKHHDGFAMYDSQVSDYNVVKAVGLEPRPDEGSEGGRPEARDQVRLLLLAGLGVAPPGFAGQRLGTRQPGRRQAGCSASATGRPTPSWSPRSAATSTAR